MRSESPLLSQLLVMLVLVAGALVTLNSPYLFSYVLAGLAILVGVAMVGVIAYVVYWLARNRLPSVQRSPSRVIRRRKKDWDASLVGDTECSEGAEGLLVFQGGQFKHFIPRVR